METKVCSKCGKEYSLDNYYKNPRLKDGLYNDCKNCRNEYMRMRNKKLKLGIRHKHDRKNTSVCKTIKQHHTILRDDPERLDSKFMLMLIRGEI
jgi:hypothetical protein